MESLVPLQPLFDLKALQQGDAHAWDAAFDWLWPTVFAVAQLKLSPFLPADVENVAIEALEELVEKVHAVKGVEELKPLAASIAHHRAVSALRERFAAKRGVGQTQSLEGLREATDTRFEPAAAESPLDGLKQTELAGLIAQLQGDLKPEQRAILNDFFLGGLSYEQIAARHGLAMARSGFI